MRHPISRSLKPLEARFIGRKTYNCDTSLHKLVYYVQTMPHYKGTLCQTWNINSTPRKLVMVKRDKFLDSEV